MVLVVDQNAPRGERPLGRVEKVFSDQEGHVRVVQVISRGHNYIEPIVKLCPLDIK